MTPEKARELLDGRTPSPWWWCETDYPEVTVYHEKYGIIAKSVDIEEADLICTAPDLAALVAGMHYEYAVQHDRYGEWLYETTRHATTKDPTLAMWWDDVEDARDEARTCYNGCNTRIVRRLVGESEVVA